jgi:hypothetical protein
MFLVGNDSKLNASLNGAKGKGSVDERRVEVTLATC